ncbi:MAG: Maf family protein [Caldilineaceae bacterium]
MQRPLILASASPRRQAFLHALGLDFTVVVADTTERPRR